MQPLARIAHRAWLPRAAPALRRTFRSVAPLSADVAPALGGAGPPPPGESEAYERASRRKRQAEILREVREGKGTGARRRFWKEVTVREAGDHLEVFLDERPLRHPTTKQIVQVPSSKPHLATALALEWDALTSALDATRQHLVPLTSLVCRALDLGAAGAAETRRGVGDMVMRYLDTDSLLCWAPGDERSAGLRELQRRASDEVVGFLAARAWPGAAIVPVLGADSIFPASQDAGTLAVVRAWVGGLSAWELAGLERAVLASKSLLVAARLVAEWSEEGAGVGVGGEGAADRFGVEKAARVASLEVTWQTGKWGEVEDTHDVEKEDIRRQLGSTVLLVSGSGR